MYGDSDRNWNCLVDLAVALSEGKANLEDLVRKIVDEDEEPLLSASFKKLCFKKPRTARHHVKKNMKWDFSTAMIIVPTGCEEIKKPMIMVPTGFDDIKKSHHEGFEIKNLDTMAEVCDGKKSSLKFKIKTIREPDKKPSYCVISEDQESSKKRKRDDRTDQESSKKRKGDDRTMQWIVDCGGDTKSAVLVMEKALFASDVNPVLARLSLPQKQVTMLSLTQDEMAEADSEGLPVAVIDTYGRFGQCGMRIKNWKINSQYALNGGWNAFCKRNKLKQHTRIQVWSFEKNLKRCLAIVRA